MPHDISLIALIAVGLSFAFIGGYLATRLGLPPLVGYLVAGVAIGPFTPGFDGDQKLAHQLAEIGVILLMFGVGMHFSINELWRVRSVAIPGAVAQIAVATLLGLGLAVFWGWSIPSGLVFGLTLSVASTVVLLKALEALDQLHTEDGRVAVGWLIVEDLVIVLALVLLPALAPSDATEQQAAGGSLAMTLALTLGKVSLFIALMLVVGSRVVPWVLQRVEDQGVRELFTLAVVALALGIAYGSYRLFDVSFALGAFFAGMVVNAWDSSHRAEKELKPLEDIFAVLFFVSIGMLLDPAILLDQPLRILAVLAIIVVGKSAAALGIVLLLGRSWKSALTVSAALAQIGEFSFILAALGVSVKLLPAESVSLLVAGAILSITLNPFLFRLIERFTDPVSFDKPARIVTDLQG
jgi:CPA2 family monovalent cation:H+ antiporter-2